jgi:hypothetical protein
MGGAGRKSRARASVSDDSSAIISPGADQFERQANAAGEPTRTSTR